MCQKNSIDELFYNHVYLVDCIVRKMKYDLMEYDDIYQSGLMGLYEACKHFDKEKGVKFSTFATYYVIGEIKRQMRENQLIIYSNF